MKERRQFQNTPDQRTLIGASGSGEELPRDGARRGDQAVEQGQDVSLISIPIGEALIEDCEVEPAEARRQWTQFIDGEPMFRVGGKQRIERDARKEEVPVREIAQLRQDSVRSEEHTSE